MSKVVKDDNDCWLWDAHITKSGYGQFKLDGRTQRAHRVAYEIFVGPIPDGLQLDHLCCVRHCVNPSHLDPVTGRENTLRGNTIPALNLAKTHCPKGHPLSGDNLVPWEARQRSCRICVRDYQREWHRNYRAKLRSA